MARALILECENRFFSTVRGGGKQRCGLVEEMRKVMGEKYQLRSEIGRDDVKQKIIHMYVYVIFDLIKYLINRLCSFRCSRHREED